MTRRGLLGRDEADERRGVLVRREYLPVAGSTFCAVAVLPATRKPGHRRLDAGAAVLGDRDEHLGDHAARRCGGTASRRTCGVAFADDVARARRSRASTSIGSSSLPPLAIARIAIASCTRRHADALTERRGRRLDLEPRPPLRPEHARRLAGQRQARRLAEPEATEAPRRAAARRAPSADLERADVRALREDLRRREPVVHVRVVDR